LQHTDMSRLRARDVAFFCGRHKTIKVFSLSHWVEQPDVLKHLPNVEQLTLQLSALEIAQDLCDHMFSKKYCKQLRKIQLFYWQPSTGIDTQEIRNKLRRNCVLLDTVVCVRETSGMLHNILRQESAHSDEDEVAILGETSEEDDAEHYLSDYQPEANEAMVGNEEDLFSDDDLDQWDEIDYGDDTDNEMDDFEPNEIFDH